MLSDIQMTEQIVRFYEQAKSHGDRFVDALPGVFAVINEKGRILRSNTGVAELFDVSFEYVAGRNIFDLLAVEAHPLLKENLVKCRKNLGSVMEFEATAQRGESPPIQLVLKLVAWNPEESEDHELFTLTGQDVTELKIATAKQARLEEEIKAAETAQKLLIPKKSSRVGTIDTACYYQPANECGGDLIYYGRQDEKIYIWNGDVTGHGVASAMIASGVRASISTIENYGRIDLGQAVRTINRCIRDLSKGDAYMSFQLIEIDTSSRICRYTLAGHPPTLRFQKSKYQDPELRWNEIQRLDNYPSMMLGVADEVDNEIFEVQLELGDILFGYTDGLVEAENQCGQYYGQRRLTKSILSAVRQTSSDLEEIMKCVQHDFEAFSNGVPQEDDVTYWAVKL